MDIASARRLRLLELMQSTAASHYFFRYLLDHGDDDAETLAALLLAHAQVRYGTQAGAVDGEKLVRWARGQTRIPRWAYAAALDLIRDLGYQPRTLADWLAVLETRHANGLDPDQAVAQLDQEFPVPAEFRTRLRLLVQQRWTPRKQRVS